MLTSVWTVILSASFSLAPSISAAQPPAAPAGKDAPAPAPAVQTAASRWSGTIELPGGQKLAFNDFAGDVLAGVEFLKTRTDIDPRHIGLVGHSEGGLIAPIAAAKSSEVAFIVMMAGTGISGAELMPIQARLLYEASGMSEEAAAIQANRTVGIYELLKNDASDEEVIAKVREIAELELADQYKDKPVDDAARRQADAVVDAQSAELASPWFRYFIKYDPATSLRKVHCPVLAINGSLDLQVPPKENLPFIEQALKEGGNTDITIVELEGLNHLFQTAATGGPDEYATIEETISPKALDTMTTWIRKRAGLDH